MIIFYNAIRGLIWVIVLINNAVVLKTKEVYKTPPLIGLNINPVERNTCRRYYIEYDDFRYAPRDWRRLILTSIFV